MIYFDVLNGQTVSIGSFKCSTQDYNSDANHKNTMNQKVVYDLNVSHKYIICVYVCVHTKMLDKISKCHMQTLNVVVQDHLY